MTLIETAPAGTARKVVVRGQMGPRPGGRAGTRGNVMEVLPARPRPVGARLHDRGVGAVMPQRSHRQRPGPAITATLALLAALITVWLGLIAQLGAAVSGSAAETPARLGVVQIESGETLQQLAARVAPGGSATEVADRIRELNGLDDAVWATGRTLISPVG